MRTTVNSLAEYAMNVLIIEASGVTMHTGRARDGSAHLLHSCALTLAMCASLSALAHAQTSTASRDARATLHRSTTMTELTTVDLPLATPPTHAAARDASVRPFR